MFWMLWLWERAENLAVGNQTMDVSNLSPPAQAGHCANQGEKIIMLQDPISGQECSLGGLKPELFSYYCIAVCYLLFNLLKGLQIVSCNKPELVLCYQKKKVSFSSLSVYISIYCLSSGTVLEIYRKALAR